ncbi:hypothetical protein L083_5577 [Actinoplanes sp. N902-109]|nr:hypothetical protein L083_5577 [Actinoplanes sp. N902-109]
MLGHGHAVNRRRTLCTLGNRAGPRMIATRRRWIHGACHIGGFATMRPPVRALDRSATSTGPDVNG